MDGSEEDAHLMASLVFFVVRASRVVVARLMVPICRSWSFAGQHVIAGAVRFATIETEHSLSQDLRQLLLLVIQRPAPCHVHRYQIGDQLAGLVHQDGRQDLLGPARKVQLGRLDAQELDLRVVAGEVREVQVEDEAGRQVLCCGLPPCLNPTCADAPLRKDGGRR
jgi:hypothetical protein